MKKSSPYYSMIFGFLFIIIGFINWYKNGVIEIGLFILGVIPILISVLLLLKREKTVTVIKSSKSEKIFKKRNNLEKYKQEIEEYDKFINNVYLCSNKNAMGNQIGYVCIHREPQELYYFSEKVVGHRGVFDVCCFAKQPQKIVTYAQMSYCLGTQAKTFYNDLNEANWKDYFVFMFLPPGS